jgi:hypothetical protein
MAWANSELISKLQAFLFVDGVSSHHKPPTDTKKSWTFTQAPTGIRKCDASDPVAQKQKCPRPRGQWQ